MGKTGARPEKQITELQEQAEHFLQQKKYEAAAQAAQQLRAAIGDEPSVLTLLTCIYIESGQQPAAAKTAAALLALCPQDAYAQFLTARVQFLAGERLQVKERLEAILQKPGTLPRAIRERVCNLLGQCCRYLGEARQGCRAYLAAYEEAEEPELRRQEYSNYLFNLHYCPDMAPAELARAHAAYGRLFASTPHFLHRRRDKGKKLRIGYISPDFRRHVVLAFSQVLLSHYTHERFEVFVYMCGEPDEFSERAAGMVDGWRDLRGMEAAAAARCIYADGVDILVDLSGHTQGSCLPILAWKPAPVQISGIGWFDTTGLPAVDYFLSDRYLAEPESVAAGFSEKLLILPHTHFCYTPLTKPPLPQGTPCKTKGYITFGCFNNFTKITDEMLAVWQKILQRVPGSHLLLKSGIFGDAAAKTYVCQRFQRLGLDLSRLELRGFSEDYLSEYGDMDIALDTYPYPGGGTTCDALYMGVPVVTLAGDTQGRRFGFSILQNAGLAECCAQSLAEYAEKAAALASDPDLLDALHRNLRSMLQHTPLLDGAAYMRDIEQAYEQVWQDFCAQQQADVPAYRELPQLLIRMKQLAAQGDWQQAMAAADLACAAGAEDRHALETIAGVYIDGGDAAAARRSVQNLAAAAGSSGYALFLRGRVSYMEHNWEGAIQDLQQAAQDNSMTAAQRTLLYNLLARVYQDLGRGDLAARYYALAWQSADKGDEAAAVSCSNYLYGLHFTECDPVQAYAAAGQYNALFAAVRPYVHERRSRHEKLRIGYISPDFCRHIAAAFSQAFFQRYDRQCFEVSCYANCTEDEISRRFALMADHWVNICGMGADEAAQKIYADEIDILVDLSGHTKDNCLPILARRPAPVQISGIGYMSTTGLQTVDYFLSDPYLHTEAEQQYFSEKLLPVPHSHFCYTVLTAAPQHCPPAPCQENGFITFGSFNNFAKVNDALLELWHQLLEQVPDARLLLKAAVFDDVYGRQQACLRLEKAGLPMERLELQGYTEDYLAAYGQVDIALDTYPYPGGGTTCDALYMGVPVITLVGQSHNERFGYSLLQNIGLAEGCAFSPEEYVSKAAALARNPARIAELHQILRRRFEESPVMDAGSYMAELEQLYGRIWQSWLCPAADAAAKQQEVRQSFDRLLAALQSKLWPVVVREAGHMDSLEACPPKVFSAAGFAYLQLADYPRAAFWLRRGLAVDKENDAELWMLLGEVWRDSRQAVAAYEAFASAWQCLQQSGRQGSADFQVRVRMNKARSALLLGRAAEAADDYLAASRQAGQLCDACDMYSSYLLSLHASEIDDAGLEQAHAGYRKLLEQVQLLLPQQHARHQRLRIGYLSPDFRHHVMFSFYYVFFACCNRERFEIHAYHLSKQRDGHTAEIERLADVWHEAAGLTQEEIARQIHADEIDILVDLAGHSAGSGLPILAWRPAPVQISGLGYMHRTGLPAVDYFITDRWCDPIADAPAAPSQSEAAFGLTSQFCYTGRSDVPAPQGAPCIDRGYVLFGVFNHYYKFTDEMLAAWREILQRVPRSRLLLKSQIFASLSVQDEAWHRMTRLGFPMDRVDFEPATADYMQRYLAVDIALDTYPYPGGGTTCDALYMGVPVISRYGTRRGSRFGLSILQNAGLGELAVDTLSAYVERAAALAQDTALLDALHRTLRGMMAKQPLMDTQHYMQEAEAGYERLWQKYEESGEASRWENGMNKLPER